MRSTVKNRGNPPVLGGLSCSRIRTDNGEQLWEAEPGPVDDKGVSYGVPQRSSASLSVG